MDLGFLRQNLLSSIFLQLNMKSLFTCTAEGVAGGKVERMMKERGWTCAAILHNALMRRSETQREGA